MQSLPAALNNQFPVPDSFSPPEVRLPASGMIFVMEAALGINAKGSFNEIVGISPDADLPSAKPPATFIDEDLLKDEWIKWVLSDGPDRKDRDRQRPHGNVRPRLTGKQSWS